PSHQAEQVAVQRAAQALVRGDQNDGALLDRTHLQQRMLEIDRPRRRLPLDAIELADEWPHRNCCLLRFPHFRRGHHLHGFGDLRRAADRSNAPPYFPRARHDQVQSGLNCSAAAFNSVARASSNAWRWTTWASRVALDVDRNSVSRA